MNRFLGTDRIYGKPTGSHLSGVLILVISGAGALAMGLLPALILLSESSWAAAFTWLAVSLVGLVILGRNLARRIIINKIVVSRKYLGKIDLQNKDPQGSRVKESILLGEAKAGAGGHRSVASFGARVIAKGEGWWLYDVTSVVYNSKGHPMAERCYTVFETKLRQIVPHLVFDDKTAKGRQFRAIYAGSQRLEEVLGHQIASRFDVYSPIHHTIETLSFITPEVIEAMLGLDGYDIEFIDNSLLCYGPFLAPQKLEPFQQLCSGLHAKVNDNLRLYKTPESEVKPFGRRLLKNYRRQMIIGGLMLLYASYLFLVGGGGFEASGNGTLIVVVVTFFGLLSIGSGFVVRHQNRQAQREFLQKQVG